jgi:predicted transcriptional regulator
MPLQVLKKLATMGRTRYVCFMAKVTNTLGFARETYKPAMDELGLTPEQKDALLQSIARGEQQLLAGEAIPGNEVAVWLRSWGKEDELPAPTRKSSRA